MSCRYIDYMISKALQVVVVGAITLLWTGTGRADALQWDFSLHCQEGASETIVSISCSREMNCVERSLQLYGCVDQCQRPYLLAENISWQDVECTCNCMMGEGSFPCGATPVCVDPYDYYKCYLHAWSTLPLPCDKLRYDYACTEPVCPDQDPFWEWSCSGDTCYGTCTSFSSSEGNADPCITAVGAQPGCSAAATPLVLANLAVLTIFGLILVFCLVATRRMNRHPRHRLTPPPDPR